MPFFIIALVKSRKQNPAKYCFAKITKLTTTNVVLLGQFCAKSLLKRNTPVML